MKRHFFKTLSVVLVLLVFVCALPAATAFAAEKTTPSGITYTQSGSEAIITGYNGSSQSVIIPDKIGSLPVTEIGEGAFKNSGIEYISIPDTIKKIGKDAFLDGYALQTVDITDIGAWCEIDFANEYACPTILNYAKLCIDGAEIKSLYIPEGTAKISAYAFYSNYSIEKVFIPQSVKAIGEMAFRGAYKIKDLYCVSTGNTWEAMTSKAPMFLTESADVWLINPEEKPIHGLEYTVENNGVVITGYQGNLFKLHIPETIEGKPVVKIGEYAFREKETLAEVIIPDTVKEIYPGAFFECKYLTKINIPEGVEIIHESTFDGCNSLGNIDFPKSLKAISYCAFRNSYAMTKVVVPEGVTFVGDGAFEDCSNLKEIKLPDTLTQLAGSAFYDTAYYKDESNWQGGALYIGKYLCEVDNTLKGEFTIRNGVRVIADYAFYECEELSDIVIPETVVTIGNYAFYGCKKFNYIYIPESVEYIGYHAFGGFAGIETVDFGGSELQWNAILAQNEIDIDLPKNATVNFNKEIEYISGDVTLDGRLNVRDATLIQKYMAKLESLEGKALELADFNNDSKINVKDATAIQKHIAGL